MWRKAVVYNLEWPKGSTPGSLCAGTGGDDERLLLVPGRPINFGVFVWARAKEFSMDLDARGAQAPFVHSTPREEGRRWECGVRGQEPVEPSDFCPRPL